MINIRMTKFAIFPLAVFILYAPLTSFAETFSAKVVRVIDGDTVQVYDGATNTRIRLYGIDAPESKQAFGQKAKQAMIQLAANQVVDIQDLCRCRMPEAYRSAPDIPGWLQNR